MQTLDSLIDFTRRLGAPRVAALLVITALGVGGIWGLVLWGSSPEWVPIVRDVPLDVIPQARQALTEANIRWELSEAGTEVLVPAAKAAEARVALAERGVTTSTRPGFELFDEASWGMTDFTQRINYRRALEGELERSIEQMRGVSAAEVHLALQEGSVYQLQGSGIEASVLLSMASGARPTTEQVESITFLVASAVEGLNSEGVSVVDDAGRVLSSAAEANAPARLDRRRLEQQAELEERLETRAAELLEPMLGAANVRVRVAAQLDYEQVERRTEAVDPNQQALTNEQRSEIEPGDPSQGAASTIQHNEFEVTRTTELSTRAAGAVKRLTVAVALNEDLPRAGDAATIQRIEALVSNAVGLDTSRGDAISVEAVPFEPPQPVLTPDPAPTTSPLDIVREFQRPIIMIFGLVLAFVLAMRGLSFARTALPEPAPALPRTPYASPAVAGAEAAPGLQSPEAATEAVLGGPQSDPTRVVRAWLGEG